MKKEFVAITLFGLGFLASQVTQHLMGGPTLITKGDAALTMGKVNYPSEYGFSDSVYLVMDKETQEDDASVVFRDSGSARVEIGIVEDNDFHIKTVTGKYGSEVFTDRFLVRATGEVDGVGRIMRQYATTGIPIFAVGDTDGSENGSGIELSYNHEAGVSNITSISRGDVYRPLDFAGESYDFYTGDADLEDDPVVTINTKGLITSGIVGIGTFTTATLPEPVAGGMIYVANGADGGPVLAYSDGEGWLRSDTLAVIEPVIVEDIETEEAPEEESEEEADEVLPDDVLSGDDVISDDEEG